MEKLIKALEDILNKKKFDVADFSVSSYRRKIYRDRNVFEEINIKLCYLIDTGDWFQKSISFDVIINTETLQYEVKERFGVSQCFYKIHEIDKLINYIEEKIKQMK